MGAEMEYSPRIGSMLDFVLPLDEPLELRGRVADVNPAAERSHALPGRHRVRERVVAGAGSDRSLYLESLCAPSVN